MYVYNVKSHFFFLNIFIFGFFLEPFYISGFPQSIYFVFFFRPSSSTMRFLFLMVRHVISVFVEIVGDLPVLFTYSVTNILHVTVFSSQNCLVSY